MVMTELKLNRRKKYLVSKQICKMVVGEENKKSWEVFTQKNGSARNKKLKQSW